MQAQDLTIEVDGHQAPLLHVGPPDDDEAVVFVHGNPGSSQDWRRLAEDVTTRTGIRSLAWDQPGFGGSRPAATFAPTVGTYAAHLARGLDHLGVAHVHLVLHDFGGPWGLRLAAEQPERVASVTLCNTGVFLDYRWHALARIWRTPLLGELFQATTTARGLRWLLRRGQRVPLPRELTDRMYADLDATTRRTVLALYRSVEDVAEEAAELATALARHDLPALVVWGEDDPYLPVELASRQTEAFPTAEVHLLPGRGHWPFVDDPVAVADLVVGFLTRHPTRGPRPGPVRS